MKSKRKSRMKIRKRIKIRSRIKSRISYGTRFCSMVVSAAPGGCADVGGAGG
jgi:hypothetical protein